MTRHEFAAKVKGKGVMDITPTEVSQWYHLFKDMDREAQVKILTNQTLINLGKALDILWENAYYQFFERNRPKVEVWPGLYLVSNRNPENPIRKKYRELIPDNMPKKECMKYIKKFMGAMDIKDDLPF